MTQKVADFILSREYLEMYPIERARYARTLGITLSLDQWAELIDNDDTRFLALDMYIGPIQSIRDKLLEEQMYDALQSLEERWYMVEIW